MATTKEHIIQYCKDHNFKLREENFDGSIYQYSKYLSKTTLLFIGVSDNILNVGIIVIDTQQKVYKKDETLPLTLIEPSYWRLHLCTMVHDVVAAVFDKMTGLGFNTKNDGYEKTIEERAREYVGAPCDDGCAICDASLCKLNEYSAFIAGAQSEHEELTRWHDPKEELPEPMKEVLVKCISDTCVVDFYVPELGCFFGESATYMKVVGWREIHES